MRRPSASSQQRYYSVLSPYPYDVRSAAQVLPPEVLLPEQFHALWSYEKRTASGQHALMRAVLQDALNCCLYLRVGPRGRRLAREAEHWFFSNDDHWPFSFVNICEALGLHADAVRARLRRQLVKRSDPPPRGTRRDSPVSSRRHVIWSGG